MKHACIVINSLSQSVVELFCDTIPEAVFIYIYRSVCVSFRAYSRRRMWSDRDQIWHTHANSPPNGSGLNKNQPRVIQGGLGGFRGAEIQKSGMTTKRMDQLPPNLAHMCRFIWEWTQAKNK